MPVDHSLNFILGATLGPLQKGLKQGVGLVKNFSATASKAITGGGLGNAIAGAVGGVTVTAALGYAVKQFSDVEQGATRLTASLKSSGNAAGVTTAQVKAYAASMLQATGTAKSATMAAAASLAQFDRVKGPNFQATITAAADYAATIGGDVVGATEKFGSALQNPKEGLIELASAGVGFTGAQMDAVQAMADAGDIAGAQGVILEALRDQYGGAAEAAGETLGGSLGKLQGSFNDVAAIVGEAVTPAIKAGVAEFQGWINGIDRQAVSAQVFSGVAKALGVVVDTVQVLNMAWKGAQLVVDGFIVLAVKGFKWIVVGVEKVISALEMLPGCTNDASNAVKGFIRDIEQFESGAVKVMEDDAAALVTAWDKPWNSTKTDNFFSKVTEQTKIAGKEMGQSIAAGAKVAEKATEKLTKMQVAARDEAGKMATDLKQQLATFGQADWQKKASDLERRLGPGGANKAGEIRTLGAQLAGKELAQSLETPFEKFSREMKKLTDLNAAGGLDSATFERAKSNLAKDLMSAVPQVKASAGGALMQGSQEARSAMMAYRNSGRGNSPQEQMLRVAEEQRKQQELTNRYLGQMAKAAAPTPTAAPNAPGF